MLVSARQSAIAYGIFFSLWIVVWPLAALLGPDVTATDLAAAATSDPLRQGAVALLQRAGVLFMLSTLAAVLLTVQLAALVATRLLVARQPDVPTQQGLSS